MTASLLPQLLESCLKLCTPAQLGQLVTTCRFFSGPGRLIDRLARQKLRSIARAKGLHASRR